MCAAEYNLGWN